MKFIQAQELQKMIESNEKFTLINVLEPEKFNESHIPKSKNIPLQAKNFFSLVHETVPDQNEAVVVYCASRQCDASTKAAKQLEDIGYKNVYDFKGGAEEWLKSGYRFESNDQEKFVRSFQKTPSQQQLHHE